MYDVVCDGYDEPSISIYLHHVRTDRDHSDQIFADDGETAGY